MAVQRAPEHTYYDVIEDHLKQSIREGRDFLYDSKLYEIEMTRLWDRYNFQYQSLQSFLRNLHVSHVKKTVPIIKNNITTSIDEIARGQTSMLQLAQTSNFPPYLFARYILEALCTFHGGKSSLTDVMRNPSLLLSVDSMIRPEYRHHSALCSQTLVYQVQEAVNADPLYGPLHDKGRHLVGVEFEVVLSHKLKAFNIPFETEAQLRQRGTSRTPDILLSAPVGFEAPKKDGSGYEWKIVCWIDSKALFGDVATHQTSVLPQAETYVNRFGPGLVIYWFGHAPIDRLGDAQGNISILAWDIPNKVMLSTSEIVQLR